MADSCLYFFTYVFTIFQGCAYATQAAAKQADQKVTAVPEDAKVYLRATLLLNSNL